MHANLFGDYVKGSDLSTYSKPVQEGIRLHRQIDSYIDHHPDVLKLMHTINFNPEEPQLPSQKLFPTC